MNARIILQVTKFSRLLAANPDAQRQCQDILAAGQAADMERDSVSSSRPRSASRGREATSRGRSQSGASLKSGSSVGRKLKHGAGSA